MLDFLSQSTPKTTIGLLIFFLLILELVVGGIILPYRENQRAQAIFADWIGGFAGIGNFIESIGDDIYDWASQAYSAASTWVSAAKAIWDQSRTIIKEALLFAWNRLRRILLNMLVNDIIAWVQGGGVPRFVTDWQSFITTAADKVAGDLIDRMGAGFLCSKFSFQLRLALSSPPTFDETATCTLSAAIANIDNFMTDFSKGGWKGWIKISESQNNYMGAYFIAADKKYALMDKAATASKSEGESSAGFLGDKVCAQRQCPNRTTGARGATENYSGSSLGWKEDELDQGDGNSCECLRWTTRTPGRQVGDALQQATGVDIPWLISAKEFAEYAGAIVDAAINRAIKEGIAAMTSTGDGTSAGYGVSGAAPAPGINSPAYVSVNISAYDDANTNTAETNTLITQLGLLAENLGKVITEYQTNLGVLNNIRTSQNNSLNYLINLLQNSCTMPTGVSVTTIPGSDQIISTCDGTACPCDAVTTEKVNLIAPGIGTAVLKRTTTQSYDDDEEWLSGCSASGVSVSYQSLSTTVAVDTEIAATNNKINTLQGDLPKIATAVTNTTNYQTLATNYMTVYEDWQRGDLTAATSTAETAMNTAKQTAINSNQTAIPSSSLKFRDFNQETMQRSIATGQKVAELMTLRGGVTDCSYAQAGLYKNLCTARSTESSYQSSLDDCLYAW